MTETLSKLPLHQLVLRATELTPRKYRRTQGEVVDELRRRDEWWSPREPEYLRLCDLVIRGTKLVPEACHIDPGLVAREGRRRQAENRAILQELATGTVNGERLTGLGNLRGFEPPVPNNTYAQLLLNVALRFHKRFDEHMRAELRTREYSKEDLQRRMSKVKRAWSVMRGFQQLRKYDEATRLNYEQAQRKPISVEVYFPIEPTPDANPMLVLTSNKRRISVEEKSSRLVVARTTPKRRAILRGDHILIGLPISDGFRVRYVFSSQEALERATQAIHGAHQRGTVHIAYDELGDRATRDYLGENRQKGKDYEAVHFKIRPPHGGPDLFEIQLMTIDALLIDLFDAETNHLMYDIRRLKLANTESVKTADGRLLSAGKPWRREQHKLYKRILRDQFGAAYA